MAVIVQLDPSLEQRLDALASQTGVSSAELVRGLIVRGLDDLEDYYLAAATMERVNMGEEKVFSAHQARQALDRE